MLCAAMVVPSKGGVVIVMVMLAMPVFGSTRTGDPPGLRSVPPPKNDMVPLKPGNGLAIQPLVALGLTCVAHTVPIRVTCVPYCGAVAGIPVKIVLVGAALMRSEERRVGEE